MRLVKRGRPILALGAVICLSLWGCDDEEGLLGFDVRSPAFEDGAFIPARHTCDGENLPVPLWIRGAPGDTVSYAVVLEDRGAQEGLFTHWLVWNIPPDTGLIDPRLIATAQGLRIGANDWGHRRYEGPCLPPPAEGEPAPGVHRYHFVVYALDRMLELSPKATRKYFDKATSGHVIAKAQLTGKYE